MIPYYLWGVSMRLNSRNQLGYSSDPTNGKSSSYNFGNTKMTIEVTKILEIRSADYS